MENSEILSLIRQKFNEKFIDEKIDFILPFFTDSNYVNSLSQNKQTIFLALFSDELGRKSLISLSEIMEEEGLLKQSVVNEELYRGSTVKARRIVRKGGWLKHLSEIEQDKLDSRNLTKSVLKTNRTQIIILTVTTLLSLFSLIISYLAYSGDQNVKLIQPVEIKSLDSLIYKAALYRTIKGHDTSNVKCIKNIGVK